MPSDVKIIPMNKSSLWEKKKRRLIALSFELTARCNNNCPHCYINLPAYDKNARKKELTLKEINKIADDSIELGNLWILLTGGEPLLRPDFFNIYKSLKKKGLLVSVFTNATLITLEHVELFKKYPPRNLEISVYGITQATYEGVSRVSGSFKKFMTGLNLLLDNGIKVRFKAMALRSNFHEIKEISQFCREKTKDYFRFDPFLNLRHDRDPSKNRDIVDQRLNLEEIVQLEKSDQERFKALAKRCEEPQGGHTGEKACNHLFTCNAGNASVVIGYQGDFRLCYSSLHPDTVYQLRKGNLKDAFLNFVPRIHHLKFKDNSRIRDCQTCDIIDLCLWCPATAYLETGDMEEHVEYFCKLANARASMLSEKS